MLLPIVQSAKPGDDQKREKGTHSSVAADSEPRQHLPWIAAGSMPM
jgi:hypothetical protein